MNVIKITNISREINRPQCLTEYESEFKVEIRLIKQKQESTSFKGNYRAKEERVSKHEKEWVWKRIYSLHIVCVCVLIV